MNRKALLISGVSLMLTACAPPGIMSAPRCESYTPSSTCQGDPKVPKVTLNLNTLRASPSNVCAERGQTIVYRLVPPPRDPGTVAVIAKKSSDTWLAGTNSPNAREIRVTIPSWVGADTDHDYSFVTSDNKCIDPRVRVR